MNLVTSTAPSPVANPTDGAHGANRVAPDADGDDLRTPATGAGDAVATAAAFGSMLWKQLDREVRDDASSAHAARDADPAVVDGRSSLLVPTIDGSTTVATRSSDDLAKKAGDDPRQVSGDDAARPNLLAANDLAAQLALVSQWAAVAPSTATARTASGDGLDIPGKLAAVRVTSRTSPDAAGRLVDGDIDARTEADAASLGAAPGGAASSPSPRGTRAAANGSTTVPAAASTAAPAPAPAKAASSRTIDVAVSNARVDASSTGSPDAMLRTVNAFATRMTEAFDASGRTQPAGDASADPFATQFAAQGSHGASAATPSTGLVSATSTVPATAALSQPVGTPAWSHEVAQATLRMAASDLQTASLRLNPEHLGPLDVQVRIDQGTAHLTFGAAHAETRQALADSRATLDQLFAGQGLRIGDCSVGDSSSRGTTAGASGDASRRDGGRSGGDAGRGDSSAPTPVTLQVEKLLGLVDTFA